jgi:hypothetical protein
MLVSNFELLVKRIAPPAQAGAVARVVANGHFLTITNTELDRSVYFSVKYIVGNFIANNANADVDREIQIGINSSLIFDGGSADNVVLNATTSRGVNIPGGDYFCVRTANLRLRAGESGLLALLPLLSPNVLTRLNMEVRGHILISQENESTYFNGNQTITETNPFVNKEAKVLISSEQRGTFLDDDFLQNPTELQLGNVRVGFDFDQIAYSQPLSEGNSLFVLAGS